MPTENKDRNKDIIQLAKVGQSRVTLSKIFNVEKRNLKRLLVRDWDKYSPATLDELKAMEIKYSIKIGEIKNVEKPIINNQ